MLVQGHPIFQESPCPVNDLRPGFNLHLLLLAWDLVGKDLNIDWRTPLPLAILLPFFCMDDIVMNDPLHFALVALCCVSVQNDAFVQKPLFWPTATTRPCGWRLGLERGLGHFGVQPMEHQGLWTTSLHNATPLFPSNRCGGCKASLPRFSLSNVERGLVSLYIILPAPKSIFFSSSCTHLIRKSRSHLSMSSMASWLAPSKR